MIKGQTSRRWGIQDFLCPFTDMYITQGANMGSHLGTEAYAGVRYNFNLETLQRITGSASNIFKVQMYDSTGDYLQGCNCLIDFDR